MGRRAQARAPRPGVAPLTSGLFSDEATPRDRNEPDLGAPIVSVSLGIPAVFLFGGATRTAKPVRMELEHGDVVVWGGPARLFFHGVLPVRADRHPLVGDHRINLTFRKAT